MKKQKPSYKEKVERERLEELELRLSHGISLDNTDSSTFTATYSVLRSILVTSSDTLNRERILENREHFKSCGLDLSFVPMLSGDCKKMADLFLRNDSPCGENVVLIQNDENATLLEDFEKVQKEGRLLVGNAFIGTCRELIKKQSEKAAQSTIMEFYDKSKQTIPYLDHPKMLTKLTEEQLNFHDLIYPVGDDNWNELLNPKSFQKLPELKRMSVFNVFQFEPSMLISLVGLSGGGKTLHLANLAAEYLKLGEEVLFFTTEVPIKKMLPLIIAIMEDTSQAKILEGIRTGDLETLKMLEVWKAKYYDRLKIVYAGSMSFDRVLSEIKVHDRKLDNLNVVFIDYIQKFGSGVEKYFDENDMLKKAKAVTIDLNIALFNAAQLKKSSRDTSSKKMQKDQSDVAGSSGLSDENDVIITFEADGSNSYTYRCLKARYENEFFSKETWNGRMNKNIHSIEDYKYRDVNESFEERMADEIAGQLVSDIYGNPTNFDINKIIEDESQFIDEIIK